MTTRTASLTVAFCLLAVVSIASADVFHFQPADRDLADLDHTQVYTWGINFTVPTGEVITEAALSFNNIYNWDNQPNNLYVHLLDTVAPGIHTTVDNEHGGDNLAGQGILLNHWQNLPASAQDITYNFDANEVQAFNAYAADGNFGLGFDPDCHFYNDGVCLTVTTAPVPEPATSTIGLMCASFILKRQRRRNAA